VTAAGPRSDPAVEDPAVEEAARRVIAILTDRRQTVAVAESLTGGLVAAALTAIPGSSVVFLGAIVAYATSLKNALLGVPAGLLAEHGPVHPQVAAAMAGGVAERLGATYGLATTGVAGPGPADGHPAGTVFVAVRGPAGLRVEGLSVPGERPDVRAGAVRGVLSLLVTGLQEDIT
jgi:nicotinamide-nucleotide amidase